MGFKSSKSNEISCSTVDISGSAIAGQPVVLGNTGQLNVDVTIDAGASVGHIIKCIGGSGLSYSGTNAGLTVKNYDADDTVVHDGGENVGLSVWLKTLSEVTAGGEYAVFSGHVHASNTGTIKYASVIYGDFTNGMALSGGAVTNAFYLENQTVTNLFALADGAEARTTDADYAKTSTASSDAAIKVTIGGVDYFIPAFSATNTNNSW